MLPSVELAERREHAPHGRRFFFEAGEPLLRLDRRDEAETRMLEALELARGQGSPLGFADNGLRKAVPLMGAPGIEPGTSRV
jgi:hypothetical protein